MHNCIHTQTRPDLDSAPALEERTRALLASAAAHPITHGRLLNTLSLLEHAGSRKIMGNLALCKTGINGARLKHLAEETRHAWFFKRAAEYKAGRDLTYRGSDILGSRRTHSYISRLDGYICRFVGTEDAYVATSYIVEVRANWFYALYQDVLASLGDRLSLKPILAEERAHLEDMKRQMSNPARGLISKFLNFEEGLFEQLLADLETALRPA